MPVPFSPKQRKAIGWWQDPQTRALDAVICDGAVRSGKTTALSLGFVLWATATFQERDFAFCGKTRTSLRRNLLQLTGLSYRFLKIKFDLPFRKHSTPRSVSSLRRAVPASALQTIWRRSGEEIPARFVVCLRKL
jgi:hypothetical protein